MTPTIEASDHACRIDAGPFRLTFRWDGARWAHGLEADGRALASSVEWEPERDDPARMVSPAYQQLNARSDGGASEVLLVGQWGPHHCSGVFHVSEASGAVVLGVDVAVRSRATLSALAATYQVHLPPGQVEDAGPEGASWAVPNEFHPGRLRFEPAGGGRVMLAESGRRDSRAQADAPLVAPSGTHRLRYRWTWRDACPDTRTPRKEHP